VKELTGSGSSRGGGFGTSAFSGFSCEATIAVSKSVRGLDIGFLGQGGLLQIALVEMVHAQVKFVQGGLMALGGRDWQVKVVGGSGSAADAVGGSELARCTYVDFTVLEESSQTLVIKFANRE